MFRNYIKTAFRNLWKFRGYSLINVLGLAIGMACVLLIMLYVQAEVSYDDFHRNRDRIYRLNVEISNPQTGEKNERAVGPYRLARELEVDFDDFEEIVRFAPQGREQVEYGDERFIEEHLAFVDEGVFNTFDFPLVKGNPETALEDPFSLVLSETAADKYFDGEDPMGKILRLRDRDFAVTGVMEDVPRNSQFQFDMLVSINCGEQVFSRIVLENWGEGFVETFVMLPEGKTAADYDERFSRFMEAKLQDWKSFSPTVIMQPLSRIYLYSQDISSFANGGDIIYVYAFSFIALFILIIACINFMNLATARSSIRAKEVGLRKVVGAYRSQLIGQFLSESTLLAVISLILALLIVRGALPYFNQLADREIGLLELQNLPMILVMVGITIFVGLAAGSYPALLLSSFKPVSILSGRLSQGLKGSNMRRVMVSLQFAISIFLLIVTGVVYQQLDYVKNIRLGFDKDHVMIFGTPLTLREQYDEFRAELLKNPQVVNAAASSRVPPGRLSSSLRARPEGVPEDQQKGMQTVWTDFDFIETMGFELAAGRSFSREFPSDAQGGFILNEAAVKDIGWTNETAINKTFGSMEIKDWSSGQWEPREGKVIGVLKDFHFESLKQRIVPTVYFVAPYMAWNYTVRVRPERLDETIAFVEKTWKQFIPDGDFEYSFVDENFARLYEAEERQGKIFGIFAMLAIFIACLGLVGLVSFTAERRRKEIGIRKVLGASTGNLVVLLSKEFTFLLGIAFIIAVPIAWYLMQGWLENFAYRASIGVLVFIGAGGITLLIAWATVGYQTLRAALQNPVHALRYE